MRTDFFKNGAVQPSGRGEVGLNRLLTRKGENAVGSIPTRSPNLIGLACGVNRGQPQGAEGVGAYSNLAKPARFLTVSCNARKRMRSDRLASGAKDHRPSCTEGRERPFNFYRYLFILFIIILIPVWGDFGLPGWVAWISTITFFAGLRQSFIDYRHIVQNRYTVQQTRSAGVSLPHGRSPFSPAATLPASHTFGSLVSKAPFSPEGK